PARLPHRPPPGNSADGEEWAARIGESARAAGEPADRWTSGRAGVAGSEESAALSGEAGRCPRPDNSTRCAELACASHARQWTAIAGGAGTAESADSEERLPARCGGSAGRIRG